MCAPALIAVVVVVLLVGGALVISTLGGDGTDAGGGGNADAGEESPTKRDITEPPGELVAGGPWSVLADDPAVFGVVDLPPPPWFDASTAPFPAQTVVNDVVADGGGLLAVGVVGAPTQSVAAVWRSIDGRTWQRVVDAVFGEFARDFDAEALSGSGIVAAAEREGVVIGVGAGPGTADAWTDSKALWRRGVDGVWQRLDDAALSIGDGTLPPESFLRLRKVVATESGFVALGEIVNNATESFSVRPLLWHSSDGSTWTEVSGETFPEGAFGLGLATSGSTVVLVGSTSGPRVAAWFSVDGGVSWRTAETESVPSSLPESYLIDVAAGPGGFVAAGSRSARDADGNLAGGPILLLTGGDFAGDVDVAIWTSVDGRSWSEESSPAINGPLRHDRAAGVEVLPDGRIVVAVNTDLADRSGATTLVGLPGALTTVGDTQPFAFASLSPGLVPGQVIAGTNPVFEWPRFDQYDDRRVFEREFEARIVEGVDGALFTLDLLGLPDAATASGAPAVTAPDD